MIVFEEKEHKYRHLESGNKLNGWTSLIKNYTEPFNADLQKIASAYSMYLGQEYNKLKFGRFKESNLEEFVEFLLDSYKGLPENYIDEITFEWEYSAILGSQFHSKMENLSYSNGFEINPFTDEKFKTIKIEKEYDNQSYFDNLFDLDDGYYAELLVWDNTMGQENTPVTMIDKCFIKTVKGKRLVWVDDIKTNKSIWSSKDKKMKGVLSSFYDNVEEKYKLQACFGAKLMSTFGFEPVNCGFTHYKNYDENKKKLYLAKYDPGLMNEFQEDWKKLYSNSLLK